MSDEGKVRDRIRKLLALARNNSSEHEANAALERAQAMMLEYGVTEVGDDPEHIEVRAGEWINGHFRAAWHFQVAYAIARLYGCRNMFVKDRGLHRFAGMQHQIDAAEETFLWVVDQVEGYYKTALKAFDGQLSKTQRAELRASFKDAAALRIQVRVSKILNDRKASANALVVVDTANEKVNQMFEEMEVKERKMPALREGFGTGAGFNAGGLVRIQKEVQR